MICCFLTLTVPFTFFNKSNRTPRSRGCAGVMWMWQAPNTSMQLLLSSWGRGSVRRSEASSAPVQLSTRRLSSCHRTGCRATLVPHLDPPAVSRRRSTSLLKKPWNRDEESGASTQRLYLAVTSCEGGRERAKLWGNNSVCREGSRTPHSWVSTPVKKFGSNTVLDNSHSK